MIIIIIVSFSPPLLWLSESSVPNPSRRTSLGPDHSPAKIAIKPVVSPPNLVFRVIILVCIYAFSIRAVPVTQGSFCHTSKQAKGVSNRRTTLAGQKPAPTAQDGSGVSTGAERRERDL
ncbi:unnamed protein product [Sphagnum troendelagicum]|uniref:Uncharacterized protein n=1 Tax=Sphagnum troendelagicum TaxID=128251 RepID=A0ABP0UH77_9BRYO